MKRVVLILILIIYTGYTAQAQEKGKTYRVYFTDKNNSTFTLTNPQQFLSPNSIDRRIRQHLKIDSTDLPVNNAYLDTLKKSGARIIYTSKWLNAATIQTDDSLFLEKISQYSFITGGKKVYKKEAVVNSLYAASAIENSKVFTNKDYGIGFKQISMLNGQFLQNSGFTGEGMRIAVLDGGFYRADSLKAFDKMRTQGNLLGVKDFVTPGSYFYGIQSHGSYVLSVMTGYLPQKLIGTAPDAGYYLIKTEYNTTESLVEEDSWVAGLEWADSAGADIISSSLGYTLFEDSLMNHYYEELDGQTAFASRAASLAAGKGIIVVNSAGNSGNGKWYYISVPADATNILTVGGVDSTGNLWRSSSRGPTADGRIKPDVSAMGAETVVASTESDGEIIRIYGTSLACPLISGLTACLWQEFKEKNSFEIMDAVRRSSSIFNNPDNDIGYGIPDYQLARLLLGAEVKDSYMKVYPNPFSCCFTFEYYTDSENKASMTLLDVLGRTVQKTFFQSEAGKINRVKFEVQTPFPQGVYFAILTIGDKQFVKKVVRD